MEHQPVVNGEWLHQALVTELVLAQGFPRSTEELCAAVRTRTSPAPTGGQVRRVLQILIARGHITHAEWPGPVFGDRPLYWVVPSSPWAHPVPRPRTST